MTVTVPQNGNVVGITINQNDTNNNPDAFTTNGNVTVKSLTCTGSPCGSGGGGSGGNLTNVANQYSATYYSASGSSNTLSGLSPGTSGYLLATQGSAGPPYWTPAPTGGSGIVSPGTFTWTNPYGINVSTIVASTGTLTYVSGSTISYSSATLVNASVTNTLNAVTENVTGLLSGTTGSFTGYLIAASSVNSFSGNGGILTSNGMNVGTSNGLYLTTNGGVFIGPDNHVPNWYDTSTCIGGNACYTSDGGSGFTAIGFNAGYHAGTSASYDTYIGYNAGYTATNDKQSTYIGYGSGYVADGGQDNVMIGYAAGPVLSNGTANTGIGSQIFDHITTGDYNTGIGEGVAPDITTGISNVCIGGPDNKGHQTCENIITGSSNTIVGNTGDPTMDNAASGNTGIGYGNGFYGTGGAVNKAIAIGYNVIVGTSNTAMIGAVGTSDAVTVLMSTFTVSSGTVTNQFRAGTYQGGSLATCGDSTHALSWAGGSFGCQAISATGGSSALAVGTGTVSAFSWIASTPTSGINLNGTQFSSQLTGSATNFVSLLSTQTFSSMTVTGPVYVGSITVQGTGAGALTLTEGSAPSGVSGSDILYADSSNHALTAINNAGTAGIVAITTTTNSAGHCTYWTAAGQVGDSGAACGTGSGSGVSGNNWELMVNSVHQSSPTPTMSLIGGTNITLTPSVSGGTTTVTIAAAGSSGTPGAPDYSVQVSSPTQSAFLGFNNFTNNGSTVTINSTTTIISNIATMTVTNVSSQTATGVWFDYTGSTLTISSVTFTTATFKSLISQSCIGTDSTGKVVTGTCGGTVSLSSTQTWTAGQTFVSSITASGALVISTSIIISGSPGTSGQVLQSGGQGAAVSWTTLTSAALSSTQTWTGGNIFQSYTNFTGSTTVSGIKISSQVVISTPTAVVATTSTLTSTMSVVLASAPANTAWITLTLPAAASYPGLSIMIYKVDKTTDAVKISGAGTDLIEGTGTITLNAYTQHASLYSTGNEWVGGFGGIQYTPDGVYGTNRVNTGSGDTSSVATSSDVILCSTYINAPVFITGLHYGWAATACNVDYGIYDLGGNLIYHTGSFTPSTSQDAKKSLSPPTFIPPGPYYLAIDVSSTAGVYRDTTRAGSPLCMKIAAAAFPLPNPITLTSPTISNISIPVFGFLISGGSSN